MSDSVLPSASPELDADVDKVYSSLSISEERWKDRQQFLESVGYMLRPKYRPGWVPSLRGKMPQVRPELSEDGLSLPVSAVEGDINFY